MECLARTRLHAVADEFLICARAFATQYLVAAVSRIAEQRMSYVGHVYAYLVGTPRLEDTFHKRGVGEIFKSLIMSHGMLAVGVI